MPEFSDIQITNSFLCSRIINKPLNHKRVTSISYLPNPVTVLVLKVFISGHSNGECNSNSNVHAPNYSTTTTDIVFIFVFCTDGNTLLQYLYQVMNSVEQNLYYHYNDMKISIPSINSIRYKKPNSI
jgi:hypothetical protein